MKPHQACLSAEHEHGRREFLRSGLLGAAGLSGLSGLSMAAGVGASLGSLLTGVPAYADSLKKGHKRLLNVFLHGGVSQLETWDPKPNTDTGGPFRPIPTSVPGTHICELLPHTAKQMHHLSIIRSINTRNNDHAKGVVEMTTGRDRVPGTDYPHLGAVTAKSLVPAGFTLPGHILVRSSPGGRNVESEKHSAAYLGPQFASMAIYDSKPPELGDPDAALPASIEKRRDQFRQQINNRFAGRRRTADTEAYSFTYQQARDLLAKREVFDITKESAKDQARYGVSEFGKHCLLARRLLEQGVPYVQVNHADYDTHHENFAFHIEQLGEFDLPFSSLLADLADRGMLEDTLVCVMSEFGRTPKINQTYGRDHWGTAWSVAMGGAGIQPEGVIGKTNANGTEVTDREVDHGHVFHTILQAVGVDSQGEFDIGGRKYPVSDPAKEPISELLT
jgi:uncharacterized protein (DUF1501 family)